MSSAVPQILAGKYRLMAQLGRGGMGQVYRAEHMTLRSQIAIKLMGAELMQSADGVNRFMREAHSAASIRSPHVVQILDFGVDAGVPYIAMELLEGETLSARLERVGRLSPLETSRIMTQVSRAMTRAHEAGVVHRDLKPDNVFLVRNDEEELTKVLDFGIAKSNDLGPMPGGTRTGAVLGTPDYMSPEQAEGARTLDYRTDIWAMGVMTFECLSGRRPFLGETFGTLLLEICARPLPIPSHVAEVPPGFDEWFGRACARAPEARFASAREAASELRRICEGAPNPQSLGNAKSGLERTVPLATPFNLPLNTPQPIAPTAGSFSGSAPLQPRPPSRSGDTAVPLSVTESGPNRAVSSGAGKKVALALAAVALIGGPLGWFLFLRDAATPPSAPSAAPTLGTAEATPPSAPVTTATQPPPVAPIAIEPVPAAAPSAQRPVISSRPINAAPARPVEPRRSPPPSPQPVTPPPPPVTHKPPPAPVNLGI